MTHPTPRPDLVSSARETSEALGGKDSVVGVARAKVLLMEMADEVERLECERERLRDEADRERLARRDRDKMLDAIRKAIGEVSEDAPNWDGSHVGLAGVVRSKVGRLEERVLELETITDSGGGQA